MRNLFLSVVVIGAAVSASAQVTPAAKPLMAEDVFKNVQVLKGITVNEFMDTMGFFAASLSLNCIDCHISESSGDWSRYADDTGLKRMSRTMVLMVNALNKANFGGQRTVSCYTCHRGMGHTVVIPSLAVQYGPPPALDPNAVEIPADAPATPSAEQILDRYIQAVGGNQRLATVTSFTAKGTYNGFDTDLEEVPVDIYAKAPGQLSTVVHTLRGDSTRTYDGHAGWIAAPEKPVPLLTLTGKDLDGFVLDASFAFPASIKQTVGRWRKGFAKTMIDGHAVQMIQGATAAGSRVKLFFDNQAGLLVRTVRYTQTIVGTVLTQTDYSDYRDVAGIKMPFHTVVTWTDGQVTTELTEIKANVPIDAAKFVKPAPVAAKPAAH